jgi:hypothetical protein
MKIAQKFPENLTAITATTKNRNIIVLSSSDRGNFKLIFESLM